MIASSDVRLGHSVSIDARQAAREFHEAVAQPNMELVIFFCSGEYSLDELAEELRERFGKVPVVGCTTAGEIGPAGFLERSLSGVSFSSDRFSAVTGCLDQLQQFGTARGHAFALDLAQRLQSKSPGAGARNSFGLMLIDGLSVREEPVARALQSGLGKLPIVGGSAGDGLKFRKTFVYHDGRFVPDSAALVLVTTSLPFKLFKTQHFVGTDERLVVTSADPAHRIVYEINGLPAAEEYARLVNVPVASLQPARFAASPVVVLIDGTDFVRSIQRVNPDQSLTFFCAIEEGLVFRVARASDLTDNLAKSMAQINRAIGRPQVVIGCDCILRRLEVLQQGLKGRVEELFRMNNTVGFSTYGEQYGGVHINQTLTGIAIGRPAEVADV